MNPNTHIGWDRWSSKASATSITGAHGLKSCRRAVLAGAPHSFNIGDFDLFTNTRISDHWSVLGELLITSDFSNEFGAELDRLLLTYRGQRLLPDFVRKIQHERWGIYPNEFHRARYFMTATSRPIMYSDEDKGGILPVHSIGITATGKIPSGTWDCIGWRRWQMAGRRPIRMCRFKTSWMRTMARLSISRCMPVRKGFPDSKPDSRFTAIRMHPLEPACDRADDLYRARGVCWFPAGMAE